MKKSKSIIATVFALPLLLSSFTSFANESSTSVSASEDMSMDQCEKLVNRKAWVPCGKFEVRVLSEDLQYFEGLTVSVFPTIDTPIINVRDLTASRGTTVRFSTDRSQGLFITNSDGVVSSFGNDEEVIEQLLSAIINDEVITFQVGDKRATYSLKSSSKMIKSLMG